MNIAFDDDRHVRGLILAARQAAAQNNLAEAERLIRQAELSAPGHPLVITESAGRTLGHGNVAAALATLEKLIKTQPAYPEVWFAFALALRASGRAAEAVAALNRSLALGPRNMAALLEKASLQEELGDLRAAATTYFNALQSVPPGYAAPPGLRERLDRAKAVVDANHDALEHFIEDALGPLRAKYAGGSLKRFDRCVDLLLKKRTIYRQQPTFLYFPELPAIEFYDRELFPWLEGLEAATDAIRAELLDVLVERGVELLNPYHTRASETAASLDSGQGRWRSYPFWREGVPFPKHMARCPRTMKALEACPQWNAPGIGPNTMFSVLEPKTRIRPHTGTANTRLVAHLALVVPPGCGFRVGAEQREWHPGEAFVFDDTIEHEAWNDSDETRAILIVDVWSPLLSDPERDLVRALSARVGEYYGKLPDDPAPEPV